MSVSSVTGSLTSLLLLLLLVMLIIENVTASALNEVGDPVTIWNLALGVTVVEVLVAEEIVATVVAAVIIFDWVKSSFALEEEDLTWFSSRENMNL